MRFATLLTFLLACSPAYASGGLSCDAEDEKVKVSISGGVTRGMGSPLFSFTGDLEIKAAGVPEDLRHTLFEREHVAQYWLDGDSLNLRLYWERAEDKPHGLVELLVMTTSEDDLTYEGGYDVTVFDVPGGSNEVKLEGRVSCTVE